MHVAMYEWMDDCTFEYICRVPSPKPDYIKMWSFCIVVLALFNTLVSHGKRDIVINRNEPCLSLEQREFQLSLKTIRSEADTPRSGRSVDPHDLRSTTQGQQPRPVRSRQPLLLLGCH